MGGQGGGGGGAFYPTSVAHMSVWGLLTQRSTDLEDKEWRGGPLDEELPELWYGHVHGVVPVEVGLIQHLLVLAPPLPLPSQTSTR